jgi:hypothetical protein
MMGMCFLGECMRDDDICAFRGIAYVGKGMNGLM